MRGDGNVHPAELTRTAFEDRDRHYYDAFRSLSAARTWNQVGPNPIQVSEVSAYLELLGITDSATKMKYLRIVQGLDIVEVKNIRSKMKKP